MIHHFLSSAIEGQSKVRYVERGARVMQNHLGQWGLLLCIFVLCALSAIGPAAVSGQSGDESWQVSVLMTVGEGERLWYPSIVADPSGNVHVFWTYEFEYIYYARWDGVSWSEPVDILFTPDGGGAMKPQAVVDPAGVLHLMWTAFKPGDRHAIYYSHAHASNAGSFRSWTLPVTWRWDANTPYLLMDDEGVLHAVYVYEGANAGIYYTYSTDGGVTWAEDVFVGSSDGGFNNLPRMAIDGRGRYHVVWGQLVEYPLTSDQFYSQSVDGGRTWTSPLKVAEAGVYQDINVAVVGDDEIHLLWNGSGPQGGRYHQWSRDGGVSWTHPTGILPLSGLAGWPSMALDSTGRLHLATAGNSREGGALGVAFHSYWDGATWARYEIVPYQDYTEYANLVVTEGNRLIVCGEGRTPGHEDFNTIWCATRRTPAPYVAPQPLPTVALTPMATLTMSVETTSPSAGQPMATASPESSEALGAASQRNGDGTTESWVPIAMGVLSVAVIVGAVIFTRVIRRRRW